MRINSALYGYTCPESVISVTFPDMCTLVFSMCKMTCAKICLRYFKISQTYFKLPQR